MTDFIWVWAMFAGFSIGTAVCDHLTKKDCADCHVGSIERPWWRKAVALAEYRKAEAERDSE